MLNKRIVCLKLTLVNVFDQFLLTSREDLWLLLVVEVMSVTGTVMMALCRVHRLEYRSWWTRKTTLYN